MKKKYICPRCNHKNINQICTKCFLDFSHADDVTGPPPKYPIDETVHRDLEPGFVLKSRYKIIEEIKREEHGTVYKAQDTDNNITVVIRVLSPSISQSKGVIDQLKHEYQLVKNLKHISISKLHVFGFEQGIYFIVTDFVCGQTFKDILKQKGSFSEDDVVMYLLQICETLQDAHKQGIFHIHRPKLFVQAQVAQDKISYQNRYDKNLNRYQDGSTSIHLQFFFHRF